MPEIQLTLSDMKITPDKVAKYQLFNRIDFVYEVHGRNADIEPGLRSYLCRKCFDKGMYGLVNDQYWKNRCDWCETYYVFRDMPRKSPFLTVS